MSDVKIKLLKPSLINDRIYNPGDVVMAESNLANYKIGMRDAVLAGEGDELSEPPFMPPIVAKRQIQDDGSNASLTQEQQEAAERMRQQAEIDAQNKAKAEAETAAKGKGKK